MLATTVPFLFVMESGETIQQFVLGKVNVLLLIIVIVPMDSLVMIAKYQYVMV